MKILVATDYSKHAGTALQYAVDISCAIDATLHVVNVHSNYVDDNIDLKLEDASFQEAEDAMSQLMSGVLPLLKSNSIPQFNVLSGDVEDVIMKYIKEEDIDLLIVGTEGKKTISNVLFGSTARALVDNIDIPILVIPHYDHADLQSKNILLALDNKEIDREELFDIPNLISKAYNMSYNILHVKKENEKDFPFDPFVLNYLKSPLSEIDIHENHNVIDGINNYVKKEANTGLIIMIKRKEGFLKSLFSISDTSKEIFKAPTPLLILKN